MCDLALDFPKISAHWNIDATTYFSEALQNLEDLVSDGLVKWTENGMQVTSLGRLFLRNIATCFDAYYKNENKINRYSKTV